MKVCAIITEYNPFHYGHKYQLDYVKKLGDYSIACIMSGQFTQNAMPAYFDKSLRARSAIMGGADAIIELPTVFATAMGSRFAFGGVKIASSIKNIAAIAMGYTANQDPKILCDIAQYQLKYEEGDLNKTLKSFLLEGKSYASSYALATAIGMSNGNDNIKREIIDVLNEPNNMLCIQYLKALMQLKSSITPIFVKRCGASYKDKNPTASNASATAIRTLLNDNKVDDAINLIACEKELHASQWNCNHIDFNLFDALCLNAVRNSDKDFLNSLNDSGDVIENRLYNACQKTSCLKDALNASKTKRYTYSRLRRICLQALLSYTKNVRVHDAPARLLACKKEFDLSLLPKTIAINNADFKKFDTDFNAPLALDMRAANVYAQITNRNDTFYNYDLIKI